ncbi:MAG: BNR-repeat neuraminidase N-terminal domain-containing protein, partial [Bacteroidota bacterium]
MASEINELVDVETQIAKLGLNVSNPNGNTGMTGFTISLKNTAASSLSGWEDGVTQVYSSSEGPPTAGWNVYDFDDEFSWDGSSNLLFEICHNEDVGIGNTSDSPNGITATVSSTVSSGITQYVGQSDDIDLCSAPQAPTSSSMRPNIRLFMTEFIGTMSFIKAECFQDELSDVGIASVNNQILEIRIKTMGQTNPLSVTNFNMTTLGNPGSDNPLVDITNAKLYYTGTISTFSSSAQVGSTINSPSGDFIINASTVLSSGTNYFWLTYDISAGATVNNKVDVSCQSIVVDGDTKIPNPSNPDGYREIGAGMEYNSCAVNQIGYVVGKNTDDNEILRIDVETTGSTYPISSTSFTCYTTGTANLSTNIDGTIKIYYTGDNDAFNTSSLFGSAARPPDNLTPVVINGDQQLLTGTNYFWLTYDVSPSAIIGNAVDGQCASITVDGIPISPAAPDPTGNRVIAVSWTGTTSTDWATGSNWSSGTAPTITTDVVIPNERVRFPYINGAGVCHDIIIENGATVSCLNQNVANFEIYGDLINNGQLIGIENSLESPTAFMHATITQDIGGSGTYENCWFHFYQGSVRLLNNLKVQHVWIDAALNIQSYTLEFESMRDRDNHGNPIDDAFSIYSTGSLSYSPGGTVYFNNPNSVNYYIDEEFVSFYNLRVLTSSGYYAEMRAPNVENDLTIEGDGEFLVGVNASVGGDITIPVNAHIDLNDGVERI